MTTMHGYSAQELQAFYCVLDSVVSEAAECELQLSVYEMIGRLFTAAEKGEREPGRLRKAILRESMDSMEGVGLVQAVRFGAAPVSPHVEELPSSRAA